MNWETLIINHYSSTNRYNVMTEAFELVFICPTGNPPEMSEDSRNSRVQNSKKPRIRKFVGLQKDSTHPSGPSNQVQNIKIY
jgi:hypothetical protein